MSEKGGPSRKRKSPNSPKQDPTEAKCLKCSQYSLNSSSSGTISPCNHSRRERAYSESPRKSESMIFGMSNSCEEPVEHCARLSRAASLDKDLRGFVPKYSPREKALRDYRAAMFSIALREQINRAMETDESDQSDGSDESNQSPPGPPKNKIPRLTKQPRSENSSSGEKKEDGACTSSTPPIDTTRPLSMMSMRTSEERLNLEVEHIVMKNNLTNVDRFATPDGHRAPLNELLGNRSRSVDSTQPPQEMIDGCSPLSSASSPEQNGTKGVSTKINKFVAGCEKVNTRVSVQLERYPITPRPIRPRPRDGSAFHTSMPVLRVSTEMQTDQVAPEGSSEEEVENEQL